MNDARIETYVAYVVQAVNPAVKLAVEVAGALSMLGWAEYGHSAWADGQKILTLSPFSARVSNDCTALFMMDGQENGRKTLIFIPTDPEIIVENYLAMKFCEFCSTQ